MHSLYTLPYRAPGAFAFLNTTAHSPESRVPRLIATLALGCALALHGCRNDPGVPSGPNILFISVDTLRADHLGFYGYPKPTSPHLDQLAAESVVFEHTIAASPWTLPSFSSIMTSALPTTHGVTGYNSSLDPSFPTLAEVLRNAGYETAAVTCHIYQGTRHGLHQGFIHFDEEIVQTESQWSYAQNAEPVTDRGVRWIEQKAAAGEDRPWFLWLHYFDTHDLYLEHPEYAETLGSTTELERYDGEIAYTDAQIARVLDALEAGGLDDDTIIVFISDHGEEFLDHGAKLHGHALYEELVRVPFFVRVPGIEPRRVQQTVRHIDIFPTLCELADVAPRGARQGRSIVPLMRGETLPEVPALSEVSLLERNNLRSIVQDGWKLIVRAADGDQPEDVKLFELSTDPLERDERSAAEPERVKALRAALEAGFREAAAAADGFTRGRSIQLTASEQSDLDALGYTGDGPPPPAPERKPAAKD